MANQWDSVVNNNQQALANAKTATENAQSAYDTASQQLTALETQLSNARASSNLQSIASLNQKVIDASINQSDSLQKLIQAQNNQSAADRALTLAQENATRVTQVEQTNPNVSYPVPNPASNTPNTSPTDSVPPQPYTTGTGTPKFSSDPQFSRDIQDFRTRVAQAENVNNDPIGQIIEQRQNQQTAITPITQNVPNESTFITQTNNQVLSAIGAPNAGEAYVAQTNTNVLNAIQTQQNVTVSSSNQDGGASAAAANQATNASVLKAIGAPSAGEAYVAQTNASVLGAIGANTPAQGTSTAASVNAARSKGAIDTFRQTRQKEDWRVRLSLAPGASNYLYNVAKEGDLLYPLKGTDGVIFPYNPTISLNYKANYEVTDIVHTNYKQYFYKNSSVEEVSIQADFTCQDVSEANYVLAMIHFFRSATKMFYGQDGKNGGPPPGTPPPLCYLFGYGQYQFSDHPVLITSFNYTLPNDVDYIRAGSTQAYSGVNVAFTRSKANPESGKKGFLSNLTSFLRMQSSNLQPGGISAEPTWVSLANSKATYIPTKLQITVTCIPIVTRRDISDNFSVDYYATGELYKSGVW